MANRAQRRQASKDRTRRKASAMRALTEGQVPIRNRPKVLETTQDHELVIQGEGPVGEPLSLVLCTTSKDQDLAEGYNLLDTEPPTSMLLGRDMAYRVREKWTLLEPVKAWVRWDDRRSAIVVSHSEGALVYRLHPVTWADEHGRIDHRWLLGVLAERLGPKFRCSHDVPVLTSVAPSEAQG